MCLAIPGKLTDIYKKDSLPMARIDFGGVSKEICLAYTPEAQIGDYALVHVGFALSIMNEEEAKKNLQLLREIAQFETP